MFSEILEWSLAKLEKMVGFRVGFKFQEFDSRPKVMIQTQKEI